MSERIPDHLPEIAGPVGLEGQGGAAVSANDKGVLAVMDDAIEEYTSPRFTDRHGTGPELKKARAAVAELIEAAKHAELTLKPWGAPRSEGKRDAALARLREAIRAVGCGLCGKDHAAEIARGYAPHGESGE